MREAPLCQANLVILARLPDHPAKRITELLPWNWRRQNVRRKPSNLLARSSDPRGLHRMRTSNVPPHPVQRWLGHASMRTTAIYGHVTGREERAFAVRIWRNRL